MIPPRNHRGFNWERAWKAGLMAMAICFAVVVLAVLVLVIAVLVVAYA